MEKLKALFRISAIPVIIASLCCLSPLILVLLGLGTVGYAASLADIFYGEYKWFFRVAGLVALGGSLALYLRREKNVCTLDDIKRRRNEIINLFALSVVAGTLGYIFFLYVVVHYAGVWAGIWE